MCEEKTTGTAHPEDRFAKNRAQEPFLIKAWKENKDSGALSRLISNYSPMFGRQIRDILAGRAINRQHREDLQQECTLAFIGAVNSFDPAKEASLSTHATNVVRGALLQYSLSYRSSYRIGKGSDERKAYYAAQKLHASRAGDQHANITEKDILDIAAQTGSSLKATRRAVSSTMTSQTCLDEQHDNLLCADHGQKYIETSSRARAMVAVSEFLASISARNKEIIERSYLNDDDPSNVELSEIYDLTPERIGQIKRRTLQGLAEHLQESGFDIEDIL